MLNLINNYIFIIFLFTLALSNNLILYFISWVGLNIALYAILLKSYNSYSIEITLKYFISGSLITIFLLFSLLLYFIEYSSFSITISNFLLYPIEDLNEFRITSNNFSKIQKYFYTLILISILFKLGAFPFHFYLPDMYEALSIKKSMLSYTLVLKIFIFYTLIKIILNYWFLFEILISLFTYSGIGSLIISSVLSIKIIKIRKIFAYSYLNFIGFILLSISFSNSLNIGEYSLFISKLYLYSYLISWFGIWNILFDYTKNIKFNNRIEFISDLLILNINKNRKISNSFYLLIFILNLSGLPPFFGFFIKAFVFFLLASSKLSFLVLLITLLTTPFMVLTYLRIIINILISGTVLKLNNYKNININKKLKELFKNKIYTKYKKNTYFLINLNKNLNINTKNKKSIINKKIYIIYYIFNFKTCALLLTIFPLFLL